MEHYINKAAAKRILNTPHIYSIKEVNGSILVVYRKNYGKASTFLSKKVFKRDHEELMEKGSKSIRVLSINTKNYTAQVVNIENGCVYHVDIHNKTCTCKHHENTGAFCKHLKAVDNEIMSIPF
jgi:hypothetical protein